MFWSFDDAIIINAEEKGITQTIGKGVYALQPTQDFFSSIMTLKSYAVHSAIRLFNSILTAKHTRIPSFWRKASKTPLELAHFF